MKQKLISELKLLSNENLIKELELASIGKNLKDPKSYFYYNRVKFVLTSKLNNSELNIINFAKWYSNMEEEKVYRAYKRFLKETNMN